MKIKLPDNLPKLESNRLSDAYSNNDNYGKTFRAIAGTNDCNAGDLFVITKNGCIHIYDGSTIYCCDDSWVHDAGCDITVEPVAVNCILDFQAV